MSRGGGGASGGVRDVDARRVERATRRPNDDDDGDDGRDRSYKPPHARDGDDGSSDLPKAAHARGDGVRGDRGVGQGERGRRHGAWTTMLPTPERQLREKSVYTSVVKAITCDSSERVRAAAVRAVVALLEGPASRQYLAIAEAQRVDDAERAERRVITAWIERAGAVVLGAEHDAWGYRVDHATCALAGVVGREELSVRERVV